MEIVVESLGVVDDLHTAAAEHVAGAHQDRIANILGDRARLLVAQSGAVRWCGKACALKNGAEGLAVLGRVDRLGTRSQDRHPGLGQSGRQGQRCLTTELDDDTGHGSGCELGLVNLDDVLEGQRLEVEPVGDVVVGGDGLRVAVDHDGLVAIGQGHRGVNTGVVELNALADPVGSRAQDDDGLTLAGCHLGLQVVAGVEVGGA